LDRTPRQEGFVLREPLGGPGPARLAAASGVVLNMSGATFAAYQGGRRDLVAVGRFIPIEAFAYWLTHGDLLAAIAREAPAIAQTAANIPSRSAAPPLPRSQAALILLLCVAGIGLGVIAATDAMGQATTLWSVRTLLAVMTLVAVVFWLGNLYCAYQHLKHRHAWRVVLALLYSLLALGTALIIIGQFP
jgi:hypothetical protein